MQGAGSPPDPFVLGRFRRADGTEFAGLVADGQVMPLAALLPDVLRTGADLGINDVLADWPGTFATLARLLPDLRSAGPGATVPATGT